MEKIYKRPEALQKKISGFCPGCMHGIAIKVIAQVIDEMKLNDKTVVVLPIGCSTLSHMFWNVDMIASPHGRAPAVATGAKRASPDSLVFAYQGDGDLAAIGFSEIMHAANRGENFCVIFANNGTYGQTGGQMAPTTLIGQTSTTTPYGRKAEEHGYPLHMAELISNFKSPAFVGRFAVDTPAHVQQFKKAVKKAFTNEVEGKGFSFIEVLTNCPTNWGIAPIRTLDYLENTSMKEYPLGIFKDKEAE